MTALGNFQENQSPDGRVTVATMTSGVEATVTFTQHTNDFAGCLALASAMKAFAEDYAGQAIQRMMEGEGEGGE